MSTSTFRVSRLASAALLLALIAGAGCAPRPAVLARVGSHVITVEDFNSAARANWTQYTGLPDQARHQLLDDLVRRALLLSLADARGLERDPAVAVYRRHIEEQVLTQVLSQQLMPRSIPVSDAEVAAFYDWSRIKAHLHLIYCQNRVAAEAAVAQLRAGRPFEQVANQFTPRGLVPPGGDLGEVAGGSLVDPLDSVVREAPIGRIVGPLEAPGEGWFVLRVTRRRIVPPDAPLEVQRPLFSDLLRQRKQRLISVRAFENLRDQYHVATEPGGAQAMFRQLNHPAAAESGAAGSPSAAERAAVVARYVDAQGRSHVYTLGEALDDIHTPDRERPAPTELPAIEAWLQQQVIRRVVVLEARRRGLDRDPTVARTIEEKVNNSLLESIYAEAVESVASTGEAGVRSLYERHASQYQRLDAARLAHVTLADSAAAIALLQHGAHSGTLREAMKMAGFTAPVIEERVTFPSVNPLWGPLQAGLQSLSQGEWAGPMKVRDGWMILQLVEKEQSAQPFEQLSPAIVQGLQQEALSLEREQRLAALTDSLRAVVRPFMIEEKVLKRLPWPPAGALN